MTSTTVRTTSIETPTGPVRLAVAVDDDGERVVALAFADHFVRVAAKVRVRFAHAEWVEGETAAADAVRRYLDGDLAAVDDIAVDATGTPFQQQVWDALRAIPAGETRSYAQIAAAIGSPAAVRAVGTANGANPIWLVVPCHRVVRSDGSVGGYGGGPDRKEWLLDHERSTKGANGTDVTSRSSAASVKVSPDRP
ncbi:MAG TPA: methylated-DNA--[protein]-cysteine S-methyltransferase [Acidimicrobiales bacterium]|nr:methylated-DNA--[protein]-cysteine S-methyltransferase [Acidimicrobiales bacterium]